jgi:hypothetical protein
MVILLRGQGIQFTPFQRHTEIQVFKWNFRLTMFTLHETKPHLWRARRRPSELLLNELNTCQLNKRE